MHADDKAGSGWDLDEAKQNAERYFGADGITLDAVRRFLADSGSPPLPDFSKLLRIALDLPGGAELGRGWERLLRSEDLSTLFERPRECTEKYGIDTDSIKTRLEAFQRRLDEVGTFQFPDPAALARLMLIMTQHLAGNSELPPMSDLEDTIRRNEEIIRRNTEILGQVDALTQEHARLMESHGLTADAVQRFIDSQYVSPEDREKIRLETAKLEEEIAMRESQIETQQSLDSRPEHARKPRMRSMV